MHGVLLDEATARQELTGCMKLLSGVLYDEAFQEIADHTTHIDRMHAVDAWCGPR